MPTNLPPEAKAKWMKAMNAKTDEEKIRGAVEAGQYMWRRRGMRSLEWLVCLAPANQAY